MSRAASISWNNVSLYENRVIARAEFYPHLRSSAQKNVIGWRRLKSDRGVSAKTSAFPHEIIAHIENTRLCICPDPARFTGQQERKVPARATAISLYK
jgi:hypothetical protein